MRNSAISTASKSLDQATSSLRNETPIERQIARHGASPEDLELRAVADRDLVGRRQAAALNCGANSWSIASAGAARTFTQERAHLTQAGCQLLRLLLVGERIAAWNEVPHDRFERRRDALLWMVTVGSRRRGRGDGVPCAAPRRGVHTTSRTSQRRRPAAANRQITTEPSRNRGPRHGLADAPTETRIHKTQPRPTTGRTGAGIQPPPSGLRSSST